MSDVQNPTLAMVNPKQDAEALKFFEEAKSLLTYANARVINSIEEVKNATNDLSLIAKLKKAMEGKRKDYVQPFQEHVKEVNEAYKVLMSPVEEADKITRNKVLAYQMEQERIRKEQEEINRLRMEAAQKEMELKGDLTESVNLVEVQPETPKRVSTDMGSAGKRDNWTWEVTDIDLVPREYLMINAGMLTPIVKAAKGQLTIPGILIKNVPILAVNSR